MDRASTGTGSSPKPIAGLAALQDLEVMLDGIEDLSAQRSVCRQVLEARRKLLGADHPATLEVDARLAAIALDLNELPAAREQYYTLLERCERAYGPRHLETLSALHGLAVTLSYLNEPETARPLYERVVAGRRTALGSEDPAVWDALRRRQAGR